MALDVAGTAGRLPTGHGPSVVSRALKVLDAFSASRTHLSLSEIGRRTGLPLATAYRLVGELAAWGALERDGRGRYRIGLRLWEVAALAPRGLGLREVAMPFLEDLYEATHENVHLAVLDGPDVVYVERIFGHDAVSVFARTGGRWAAHATGVGLVLLAHAPVEAQERYLASPLTGFTEKTITDPRRLRRTLAEVRRNGVAVSDGQVTLDAVSVAAPIRDATNEVVAALSIVVRAGGAPPMGMAPAVLAVARGISRTLGGRDAATRTPGLPGLD